MPGFTSFSQFLELGVNISVSCKYSGSQVCVFLCGPRLSAHKGTSVPSTAGVCSELNSMCATLGQIMGCSSPQGKVSPSQMKKRLPGKQGTDVRAAAWRGQTSKHYHRKT